MKNGSQDAYDQYNNCNQAHSRDYGHRNAPFSAGQQFGFVAQFRYQTRPRNHDEPLITTLECVREGKSNVRGIEMSTVADPPAVVNPTAVPAMRASIVKSPKLWLATIPGDQILIGLLILLAAVCYGNSLFNGFVYDDEQQILQNPYVKSWHYLPQIIGTTVWSFIGAAGTTNYYRPLMTFTYLLLWQFFKDIPSALIFSMSR